MAVNFIFCVLRDEMYAPRQGHICRCKKRYEADVENRKSASSSGTDTEYKDTTLFLIDP